MVNIINRQAAYKDTGLEPEEIKELCTDDVAEIVKILRKMSESGEIDHLCKLLQAEKDGRLPNYTIGDTIYDRFCNAWEVIAAEILLIDGHPQWLYRCGHTGTDDYCALWENEIVTHDEAAAALKGGDNNA